MFSNTRLVATAVTLAVGFLAPKIVDKGWKMVTGHNPPEQDEKGHLMQVLFYSALSAMAVTAIERGASMAVARFTEDSETHAA